MNDVERNPDGSINPSALVGYGATLALLESEEEVAKLLLDAVPSIVPVMLRAVVLQGCDGSPSRVIGSVGNHSVENTIVAEIDDLVATRAQPGSTCRAVIDPEVWPALAGHGIKKVLIARLGTLDRSLGHLVVTPSAEAASTRKQDAILQMLASHASIAIHRIRLDRERADKEAALRESEARYRRLYEGAPMAYFSSNPDGRVKMINDRAVELLGYERDDIIGRSVINLYADTGTGKARARQLLQQVKKGIPIRGEELQMQRADGSALWVNLTVRPIRDEQGEIEEHWGMVVDITERKKMEEALRNARDELEYRVQQRTAELKTANEELRSEIAERKRAQQMLSRQAAAMDASMVGIGILDEEERFIYTNPALGRMYGHDGADDLLGTSYRELFDEATVRHLEKESLRPLRDDGHWQGEASARKRDGTAMDVELILTALEQGGMVCICQDITARKQDKEALRDYAHRLEILRDIDRAILGAKSPEEVARAALAHMQDLTPCVRASVAVFDHEKGTGTILALWRRNHSNLVPGLTMPVEAFHLPIMLHEGEPEVVRDITEIEQTTIIRRLREEGIRSYFSMPMTVEDGLVGIVNLGFDRVRGFDDYHIELTRDVAAQLAIGLRQAQLVEQVRRHSERLEQRVAERTAELESFTYSVSHDLRTPLRAIDGFSRILREQYGDCLDEEAQRLINVVYTNAQRMHHLIDDLLALSRLGRSEMRHTIINTAELVYDVYNELARTLEDREVQLVVDDLPPAYADRAMLRQVFVNLLSNALKFTVAQAPARIEVGSFFKDGDTVYFVRDNGTGFDMDYADQLFEVFQRLHDEDEYEGTGVGLAIVERIIRRHDGRVWAAGAPGEGAAFYFTLGKQDHAR